MFSQPQGDNQWGNVTLPFRDSTGENCLSATDFYWSTRWPRTDRGQRADRDVPSPWDIPLATTICTWKNFLTIFLIKRKPGRWLLSLTSFLRLCSQRGVSWVGRHVSIGFMGFIRSYTVTLHWLHYPPPVTTRVAAVAPPKPHNLIHHRHQRNPTTRSFGPQVPSPKHRVMYKNDTRHINGPKLSSLGALSCRAWVCSRASVRTLQNWTIVVKILGSVLRGGPTGNSAVSRTQLRFLFIF